MDGKKRIALILALLLILYGCTSTTLKPNLKYGCCDPAAAAEGRCELAGDTAEGIRVETTYDCDTDEAYSCDVSISRPNVRDDGTTERIAEDVAMPICTEISGTTQCINNECVAQVCGPFSYRPAQILSYKDTADLQNELQMGKRDSYPIERELDVENLYGAKCTILPMDDKFENVFKNTQGSFINTFRFGIGSTFEDFEKYRQIFPFTDNYCNVNYVDGAKDRYSNYFTDAGENVSAILDGMSDPLFCPTTQQSPFRNDIYSDSVETPNYKFEISQRKSGSETLFESTQFDRDFYDQTLRWLYRNELRTASDTTEPVAATFECGNPVKPVRLQLLSTRYVPQQAEQVGKLRL